MIMQGQQVLRRVSFFLLGASGLNRRQAKPLADGAAAASRCSAMIAAPYGSAFLGFYEDFVLKDLQI